MSPSNEYNSGEASSSSCNGNYIGHQVSKLDTLAGVAIKYGVEVADIKRLNGLATDLQMFALKTLQIPLPGPHPPSPNLSNGSAPSPGLAGLATYNQGLQKCPFLSHIIENNMKKTPPRLSYSNMLESFESLRMKSSEQSISPAASTLQLSSAMNSLRKYYGLRAPNHNSVAGEGMEMAVYKTRTLDYFDDGTSSISDPLSNHHKSRNIANGFLDENGAMGDYVALAEVGDCEKSNEKSVRRRQKTEAESGVVTPEKLLKEENGGGSSGFSPLTGKGLAMRPKSASRTSLYTDSESSSGWLNSIPVGLGDSILTDGLLVGVRKSSSTPSFQDQDNTSSWPTSKQARPIFDGLPKPITGHRRTKAALD